MNNSTTISSEPLSDHAPTRSKSAEVLLSLIRYYQRYRSGRLSPCRFFPSCSNYGLEAIEVHGSARGLWLTFRRLLRCRPLGPHGIDLVPEPKKARSSQSCTR